MNRDETRNVLTFLKTNYPQSFRLYTEESSQLLLDIWAEGLKEFPAALVQKAVMGIVMNDSREFAPNIGQVRLACLGELAPDQGQAALDAWQAVKKFIRNIGHDAQDFEDYARLPEPIRAIYSVSDLRSMAMNKSEDNDTYEKPRFIKAYTETKKAELIKEIEGGKYKMIEAQTKGKGERDK